MTTEPTTFEEYQQKSRADYASMGSALEQSLGIKGIGDELMGISRVNVALFRKAMEDCGVSPADEQNIRAWWALTWYLVRLGVLRPEIEVGIGTIMASIEEARGR